MIRYSVSEDDLRALIDAHNATWLDRAKAKTDAMAAQGQYSAGAPNWSDIKPVFVVLQQKKCAYCEKYIEGFVDNNEDEEDDDDPLNVGAVEQDIEHYRPKSEVKPWAAASEVGDFAIQHGNAGGYYLLAYDLWNYCVSCKTCNSTLKGNWFPIAGTPGSQSQQDIRALNAVEQPYLLYPIGDIDDDPEDVITFRGIHPVPTKRSGMRNIRARLTIRFFRLDTRETLLRQRCEMIISLQRALVASVRATGQEQADAQQDVTRYLDASSNHCNCARAFCKLFLEDANAAYGYVSLAREYLGVAVAAAA